MGIKQIASDFSPTTYHFKHHKQNQRVKITENVEYAAGFLEEVTWGKPTTPNERRNTNYIVEQPIHFDTSPIKAEEILEYIRKTKRRKATGPNEIPI